nr:hypothetical protein [Tanacetum cinerariifolium]
MDQNIDFSGSDQIQTPQYPDVHSSSQEMNEEVFQAEGELMKSIQTFLETFICIPFEEKPQILFQAWFKFFAIQYAKPEDTNELFQKLLEDLKELLIEECSTKVSEEQKQSMEDTMLELVKICRQKEFLRMHDNVDDLIESDLNTKLLLINSQHLDNKEQGLVPILSTKEPEYSSSMGYEHPNTTPKTESEEIIKSASLPDPEIVSLGEENVVHEEKENDVKEKEVDLEDISQIQDVDLLPIFEESDNSLSDTFLPEFETFCVHSKEMRSGNTTTHADNSLPNYDSFFFEIEPDQERLINVVKNDIFKDSSNDPLLEEADLFFAFDNSIPPGIENVANDSEGDIRFLEELLIDDSILSHESSESNFEDNPSIPRPPPELPDVETDAGE